MHVTARLSLSRLTATLQPPRFLSLFYPFGLHLLLFIISNRLISRHTTDAIEPQVSPLLDSNPKSTIGQGAKSGVSGARRCAYDVLPPMLLKNN